MRLRDDTRVAVGKVAMDPGRFGVFIADPPYSTWLNVPCSFATAEGAGRVADVIRREGRAEPQEDNELLDLQDPNWKTR